MTLAAEDHDTTQNNLEDDDDDDDMMEPDLCHPRARWTTNARA